MGCLALGMPARGGHVTCGACWDTTTPPPTRPVDRMTDTCKKIKDNLRLRAVKIKGATDKNCDFNGTCEQGTFFGDCDSIHTTRIFCLSSH